MSLNPFLEINNSHCTLTTQKCYRRARGDRLPSELIVRTPVYKIPLRKRINLRKLQGKPFGILLSSSSVSTFEITTFVIVSIKPIFVPSALKSRLVIGPYESEVVTNTININIAHLLMRCAILPF